MTAGIRSGAGSDKIERVKLSRLSGRFPLLSWLASHEVAVLMGIAVLTAGIWLFIAIADSVMEGHTQKFDERILLAFRHPGDHKPLGPPAVLDAARDITALGGAAVLGLLTAITVGFLVLDGKYRMALFVCGSVFSGLAASLILKDSFHRPRPDIVPHEAYFSTASFPSGHSMLSALTYLTLGALLARSHERKRLKVYFLVLAALLSFLVGVSRIYLGVHWPTDVLAGWTAGAVWAILWWFAARWLQHHNYLETQARHAG